MSGAQTVPPYFGVPRLTLSLKYSMRIRARPVRLVQPDLAAQMRGDLPVTPVPVDLAVAKLETAAAHRAHTVSVDEGCSVRCARHDRRDDGDDEHRKPARAAWDEP